ncbi:MAG: phosphodiester glycosidase family protein [Cyanobacteria bacterium SIG30]|nr:phosphodiester glycosidase family protein [Cyanobacteria bacterium SIG30]
MLNTTTITHLKNVGWRGKAKSPHKISPHTKGVLFLFFVFLISGVILVANEASRPIFASELAYFSPSTTVIIDEARAKSLNWQRKIEKKYGSNKVSFVTRGVAHIKLVKYINKKPVKINIIEINPKINKDLVIKPQIAGEKLNRKAKITKIATKENAIVALNGGYFKPQTGVPLGALMVDGNYLTGPIYNRAGIGIKETDDGIKFTIGKTGIRANIFNDLVNLKIDNINQPRMLSTYVLVYTPIWGSYSPQAPQYGANALIQNGKVVKMSANPVEIPENSYVISGPKEKIYRLANMENLILDIKATENFKNVDHIIAGGPYLIKNGELYIDYKEEKLSAIVGANPRSAIGYNKDGEFMFVTIDGREKASVGMTLGQLAKFMQTLGCDNAINLDGGGSSVLYVNGKIENSPAQTGGIPISNALIVSEK